jgi:uncharacterized membrane protein HdeD (DUF308 family)
MMRIFPNAAALADRWWAPVLRGAVAILFGIAIIARPELGLLALVILWGAYAITDGILALVLAARGGRAGGRWGWLIFAGVASIHAGIGAFVWPGMTALILLALIALRAIVIGAAELAAAVRLRKQVRGEWMLGASGVFSILFGVLLLTRPDAGALAVVWMIAAYAFVVGVLLVGLGLRLRSWGRGARRELPTGGIPTAT